MSGWDCTWSEMPQVTVHKEAESRGKAAYQTFQQVRDAGYRPRFVDIKSIKCSGKKPCGSRG